MPNNRLSEIVRQAWDELRKQEVINDECLTEWLAIQKHKKWMEWQLLDEMSNGLEIELTNDELEEIAHHLEVHKNNIEEVKVFRANNPLPPKKVKEVKELGNYNWNDRSLPQEKIDRIIELRSQKNPDGSPKYSIDAIRKITGHAKSTICNYLRQSREAQNQEPSRDLFYSMEK